MQKAYARSAWLPILALSMFACQRATKPPAVAQVVAAGPSTVAALPTGAPGPAPVPTVGAPASCHYRPGNLPDLTCTPGAINPNVTVDNLDATICRAGWTATIRPLATYTSTLKRKQLAEYGTTLTSAAVEEDHLVSLELGGAPWDQHNLFPQPYLPKPGAHEKDAVEGELRTQVCALPHATAAQNAARWAALQDAQRRIAYDWLTAYHAAGDPTPITGLSETDEPPLP